MLAKLSLCRTAALGGHRYRCDDCGGETNLYNSCGDRHCPQCSGGKRYEFSERAASVLLEGIVYYQVVFTLPGELSRLALGNRRVMADLLCGSGWKSLRQTIRREQDYDPAAIAVLHTWSQRLESHWHVHMLVPGAGPGIRQPGWKAALPPAGSPWTEGHYLVDAENLRTEYRRRGVAQLNRLWKRGQLKLEGEFADLQEASAWQAFTRRLLSVEWVSYIEPPPSPSSDPNQVVRYLTRYLTGGPISDARILAVDRDGVTFLAREGSKTGGERQQVPVTLPTDEFVRRWCLHIQPRQLTKTRYLGGWHNTRRERYLDQCVRQMDAAGVPLSESAAQFFPPQSGRAAGTAVDDADQRTDSPPCVHCGSQRLQLLDRTAKRSWRELLDCHRETCPAWYAASLEEEERRFWDRVQGTGFYDWYLEHCIESAYQPPAPSPLPAVGPPPRQLYLPGIPPGSAYPLESF